MKLFIVLCFVAAVAMAAEDDTKVEDYLYEANNQFTAKMFPEVYKNNPGKSVVMSAFSVLQPLAQLSLGAVGQSHDEILKTIGIPNDNVTKAVFPFVNSKLRSVKGIELRTANKIYIPIGYELNDNYALLSKDVFNSEVTNVDFLKSEETAHKINSWVEDQTNHRIKDLVDPSSLNSDTRGVLVNAIYFKGQWKNKFHVEATKERDFHVSKEKTIKVPTMFTNGQYKYGESKELDAKLLELPYQGDEASFLIVLPNEVDGITSLQEKLKDPTALAKAVSQMNEVEVNAFIPKFKIETTTNLKDVLLKIGITSLFDSSKAKLDNILKGQTDLYVSEAIQKAFIEVNEEGAEAAAANAAVLQVESAIFNPEPPVTFEADKPFFYQIGHSKIPLFSGLVAQPES